MTDSLRALRSVYGNPGLRRLQVAWAGSILGGWAYVVALAVFAFREHGAYAVGVLAVARWVIAGVAAPIAGVVGDRYPRVAVMALANALRGAAMAAIGLVILVGVSPFAAYGLAMAAALAGVVVLPAQAALIPTLAETPEQLTAANVSSSTIRSVGEFAGPALAGFVLAATSPEVVFFATAGLLFHAAFHVTRIREAPRVPEEAADGSVLGAGLAGLGTILHDKRVRLVVGLLSAYALVDGVLDVLIVVLAIETLELGAAGVGFLNSTAGAGGLVGVIVAAGLVGRTRLAAPLGVGMALWGLPLLLIGLWPSKASALALLAAVGAATTLLGVAGQTLLQRAVPGGVLARVFGVYNGIMLAALAVGSAVAPVLEDALGARGALLTVGAVLPLLAFLFSARLRAVDADAVVAERPLRLLEANPIFRPLAPPVVEGLASRLAERRVAAGQAVFRQGDPGDEFFLVADGLVRVAVDGEPARELGPGEGFGEIALLRDVPRTATVEAVVDTTLYSLDRAEFIAAVTGHAGSADAAERVAASRLAAYRPSTV